MLVLGLTGNLAVLGWFKYYDGYDPLFTWWAGDPYKKVDEALTDYSAFLRERVVMSDKALPTPRRVFGAMRILRRRLTENSVISISALASSWAPEKQPIFDGIVRLTALPTAVGTAGGGVNESPRASSGVNSLNSGAFSEASRSKTPWASGSSGILKSVLAVCASPP